MRANVLSPAEAKKIPKASILVVGDVLLDLYIRGDVHRISPEAPVPVLVEERRDYSLGGAGNVARNIAALGAGASLLGMIGNDEEGSIAVRLCRENRIVPMLISEKNRPTPLKTRALAGYHQLLRVDRERILPATAFIRKNVYENLQGKSYDLVVFSDYVKGFLTKEIVTVLKKQFGARNIIANIKPAAHTHHYKGLRLITLNAREGRDLTGIYGIENSMASRAVRALSNLFSSSIILTRGERGMTVYDAKAKKVEHIPSRALQVFDVTGAGDTVVAVTGVLLGIGMPLIPAAHVANKAAGMVVGREGTAAVGLAELLKA